MLRRTRFLIPLATALAIVVGRLWDVPLLLAVVVATAVGLAVDQVFAVIEERRLQAAADRVSAFAADIDSPTRLPQEGSRQWQELTAALNTVAEDLSDRFAALRSERERVSRLLDALPTAALVFSDDALAYANPKARELLDLHDVSVGLSPLRALGDDGLAEAVTECRETGRDLTLDAALRGREVAAVVIPTRADEVALVLTDVTDLRRLEHVRRDFVANASHELKTPVTGMQALAESLRLALERDPDRALQMVERIEKDAARLAQLVRDLLDLTRVEEVTDAPERQRVDLAAVCSAQVARLRPRATERGVRIRLEVDDQVGVVGARTDLGMIVANLVANAVEYNRPEGVVTVALTQRSGTAVLSVTDTGIGISEVDQTRVFERFYRVDKARSRRAGGTGLGLSLVRNAVQRHGGEVEVRSILGEGSTFEVRLPVDGGSAG